MLGAARRVAMEWLTVWKRRNLTAADAANMLTDFKAALWPKQK